MAQRTETYLIDDLHAYRNDGEQVDADETVEFGLDGKLHEIDLGKESAAALREFLADYVAASRLSGRSVKHRTPATATSSGDSRPRSDRADSQKKREWARQRGMKVSDRGRIPSEVDEAYRKAHGLPAA